MIFNALKIMDLMSHRCYTYTSMIHILHTADLHLGKIIFEHSLINDQKHVMNQLLEEACKKETNSNDFLYSALIVSGDIYDRSIPPGEAVELFDEFLTMLHKIHPGLHIFLIPGNHDSAQRLSYASRILQHQNIHIHTSLPDISSSTMLVKGNEKLAVFQIPFLTPSFYENNDETDTHALKSQSEILTPIVEKIGAECLKLSPDNSLPCIASAHVFTLGAQPCDSERAFLGTAEIINADVFKPFSYTALGHIHKPQKVGERVYYAGSPLAYSFSESGTVKKFLHIACDCTRLEKRIDLPPLIPITIEEIPVVPLHKASRIKGSFTEFYSGNNFDSYVNDYLEITFTDISLIENPMQLLKMKFPFLLSINQSTALQNGTLLNSSMTEGRKTALSGRKSLEDIFTSFVQDLYDKEESTKVLEELLPLFISTAKEAQEGENKQ